VWGTGRERGGLGAESMSLYFCIDASAATSRAFSTAGTGTGTAVEEVEEEGGAGEDLAPLTRPSKRDFFKLLPVSSVAISFPSSELLTVASRAEWEVAAGLLPVM
jgi:hypothetical protein